MFVRLGNRSIGGLATGLLLAATIGAAGAPQARASVVYQLTPLDINGYIVTGTIVTDGTRGALSAAHVLAWHVDVGLYTDYRFTNANTRAFVSDVFASNGQLLVATSPDGVDDGGLMLFSGFPAERAVRVADFTGLHTDGGEAMYLLGGAFDFADLLQPNGSMYVAATATGANTYALTPVQFPGGAVMTGVVTTSGASGALAGADFTGWDILVREGTVDAFSRANSSAYLFSGVSVSPDGSTIRVSNPSGGMEFLKSFVGGHKHSILLADFQNGANRAAYFRGSLVSEFISPLSGDPLYAVATGGVPCVGDADGDLMVTFADLNLLLGSFNLSSGMEGYLRAADMNGDGVVDFADLNLTLSNFGQGC